MLSGKNFAVHFRIINLWLVFILFLIVLSNLPHQPAPVLSWINCSIYFLLFLQCLYLFKHATSNRYIFLNLALFGLVHSLSFVTPFFGEHHVLGSQYFAYYFFTYLDIAQSFVFVFCVVFITINYLLKDWPPLRLYLLALGVVLPVFLWYYGPFLVEPAAFLRIEEMTIEKKMLLTNMLGLLFVFLYGILLYKYDRSLGEHVNNIVVCFFIMLIMDTTNLVGYIYRIAAFTFTQYVLLVTLSFFIFSTFRLLNYALSDFARFYDSLMVTGNYLGVPIKRKRSLSVPLLDFIRAYLDQKRNAIGFFTLLFVLFINIFEVSLFVKLNLAALSLGLMILFYYLSALYQKRLKNGNLLTLRRSSI